MFCRPEGVELMLRLYFRSLENLREKGKLNSDEIEEEETRLSFILRNK